MSSRNRPVSSISLRSKIKEDHLTCTICFCAFEKPKALPCLHTFDEDCLIDYVRSRGFEASGQFPCPVCRKDTVIPAGGIANFPDNHLVLSLNDTVEKSNRGPPVPPRPTDSPVSQRTGSPGPSWTSSNTVYPQAIDQGDLPLPAQPRSVSPYDQKLLLKFGEYGGTIADLQKPYGFAMGKRGEFIVTDLAGNRVLTYSHSGELIGRFSCTDCKICDVTVTQENNILLAVRGAGSALARLYNMDGHVLQNIGEYYKYDKPSGIALTSKNQIIVSNLEGDNIYILTSQFKMSKKFGWKGSGSQHFNSPNFLTIDSKDNIIVSDNGNDCIKMFDHTGEFVRKFGEGLICPMGIAVDKNDNIIVADAGNQRVQAFTNKGHYIRCVVDETDVIGPDVRPINVAITPRNNVAVLLRGTQFAEIRVYQWKPT